MFGIVSSRDVGGALGITTGIDTIVIAAGLSERTLETVVLR
jgi:hypothetical protein